MKEIKPTYEEFEASVWNCFSKLADTDMDSEERKFFEDPKQKAIIKNR